jgi:hypothetical protein
MPSYRLHQLGSANQIVERYDFDAEDDEAAIAQARQTYPAASFEIWELGRLVVRISAAAA